jgi:hypothetical protein
LALGDIALDQGFQQHLGAVVELHWEVVRCRSNFNDVICR